MRKATVILNALFAWLTEAGYLAGNPLALARRRRAPTKPRITRYLSHDLWATVKDAVEAMPTATERERLHAARCRWLCTVLYLGGLRASEVTGTAMGAFFARRDAEGIERWWLEVTGKGNKTPLVPATDELVAELARYRRANGLPPTPQFVSRFTWHDTMGFEQLDALKKQLSEQARPEKAARAAKVIKKAEPSRARDTASAQPAKACRSGVGRHCQTAKNLPPGLSEKSCA